ncbi:metal ABC transporter substrate-binding protein [Glutamicibacter sp. M10]|uniref:metal ABC transporter substrate-binding protein n=1 Tax=Glutamicibacter sp. M10 TaxID=3023076 RepID=UPI0021C6ADB4|nr:metal ABC transporter substrate-binding protein [Glutamicibacter sp. M10]UXN32910.1 metal ABC transporter substrate-binding protein [Glutamicibacter sp. M10]
MSNNIRHSGKALALLLGVSLLLTGCIGTAQQDEKPSIVVTTNILGNVVQNLVGDQAQVHTLMPPNVDPHSFEISAQQAALLHDSDLVVSNGLNLEEGLQHQLDAVDEAENNHFVASDHFEVLEVAGSNGAADPHFWTDPAKMIQVVDALHQQLKDLPGISAEQLASDTQGYRAELTELEQQMTASFAQIPEQSRALVTNHHVFGYLAERFGFKTIGAVIPSGTTLASPSAADLASLAEAIRSSKVPAIFVESAQPGKLARALADEAQVEVQIVELYSESLTPPHQGADSYLQMMQVNTERITHALRN